MSCCQCQGVEQMFDDKNARKELKSYHKKGASKTTQLLVNAVRELGDGSSTLLDVGGGVGAIQHALLKNGFEKATHADASSAYLTVSKQEAERQGTEDRVDYRFGNFVEIAPEIKTHDVVTLDRVICCFDDMPALVRSSAERAEKLYGVVYPRDRKSTRIAAKLGNFFLKLLRKPFRGFIHKTEDVEAILRELGFQRKFHKNLFIWQVAVFAK